MKKILFLITAFVFMGIVISSCSKDDDVESKYSIVGVWQQEGVGSVIYEFKSNNTWHYYGHIYYYENNNPSQSGTYTFDGRYLIRDGGFKEEIIFSENGNQMKFESKQYTKIK